MATETFTLTLDNHPDVDVSVTINDTSQTPGFEPDFEITVGTRQNLNIWKYVSTGTDRVQSWTSNENQAMSFNPGDKVRFVVNASGHPFYIKTSFTTGTGDQASGVVNNGAETGNVDWTVPSSGTFYYVCQYHGSMGNNLNVL